MNGSAGRATGPFVVAALAAIAVGVAMLPSTPIPRLTIVAPLAYFVAFLAEVATAMVLLATWLGPNARRSALVLALSFAANAVVLFAGMLALPLLPTAPPVIDVPPQFGIWSYVFWHIGAGLGAVAYVTLRRDFDTKPPSRRFTLIAIAIALLFVAFCIAFASLAGATLPPLSEGTTSVIRLATSGVGPVVDLFLALTTLLVFRLPDPGPINRALALSLATLTVELTLYLIGGHRFTAEYYVGRVLVLVASLFVLVAAVRTLVASRTRLGEVESTLSRVEDVSARRAGRIRAVWQIAAHAEFYEADRVNAILEIATGALRPGTPMLGCLSRLEGDTLHVEAIAHTDFPATDMAFERVIFPGATFKLDKTMSSLRDAGHTRAWDNLAFIENFDMTASDLGTGSFIGTPITIARNTHFLTFSSPKTMADEGFAEDDIAYVDVVASFFINRFTQEQQFERIQFQVEHDALTGLENRVQFRKGVRDEIRSGEPFAVALVDLDGFRHVNEREGHQIGDEVLVEVASAMANVSANDLVARLSADEFGILLRGAGTLDATNASIAKYASLFKTPFHTGDRNGVKVLGIGASIGAARYPDDGSTAEELLRRSDVALDVAKTRGGATTMIFDPPMEVILEESHLRVVELTDAIANDQLAMVYQPTFDLATRRIIGAEALVRWDHPERGRVMPIEFIGFAEQNGLIGALSTWVFHCVARNLLSAPVLPPGFRLYFNVAAQMLDDIPFIADVNATLRANPRLSQYLGIEVTETAAMQNVERSMNTIDLFRRWGLSVAIDDFGTGYSSLSYLKQLTVDVIKIDRSFVTGLPEDERDAAITEMLLRITDRFGFATLAEGIETEAQAAWLLEHGCRFGQGYLVAKPRPFDELLERLGVTSAV